MRSNSNLQHLRKAAREIFDAALHAVDARAATRRAVCLNGSILRIAETEFDVSSRSIYVVSIGKAAVSMTLGVSDAIGERITTAIISGPEHSEQAALPSADWHFFVGGHPLPNEASLGAAQAVFDLVDRANAEHAVLIFLVSGGGSAMIESPISEEISLSDLREANRMLVACGASISEINSVRRGFSAVKGGALARRAHQANLITLIVSDTNPGDEVSVASGPTL